MKKVSVLMAVIFCCVIGFSTLPGEAYAKSNSKEVTAQKTAGKIQKAVPQNLDINSADKDLLVQLPGVGPKTADAIIEYRKANGEFKRIDDLTNVKGIGDKKLLKLKPYLKKIS
jgi:competence protein ComEA